MKREKLGEQREEGEPEKRKERREEGRQRKEKERTWGVGRWCGGSFSTLEALRLERTINSCLRHPAWVTQTGNGEGWEAFPWQFKGGFLKEGALKKDCQAWAWLWEPSPIAQLERRGQVAGGERASFSLPPPHCPLFSHSQLGCSAEVTLRLMRNLPEV